ncbi:AKH_1a_G0051730.mRNA.1.CDS.1 [Saccharomyces cerevisiae]|nr:AKH_1a_G0051730.mRNA.1.CDS.1 [Saccharomyces cerevisiae]CAI6891994.1 AKH_1a_G0051730.mRNA.1.CDS.1 [Saccharomyces cerevisiae]
MPWAKLKLCGESMIEVRISKSSKWWKAEPGQYIYLYFLRPKIFWQSHPFTVMDSLVEDGELVVVITVKNGLTKKLQEYFLESEGYTEMNLWTKHANTFVRKPPVYCWRNRCSWTSVDGNKGRSPGQKQRFSSNDQICVECT